METKTVKKRGFAGVYMLCPFRHTLLLISALIIAAHLLTRGDTALMERLSAEYVRPLHRALARINSALPFSVAELLIALAVFALAAYLLYAILSLILRPYRLRRLYRLAITLLTAGMTVYALFCLLWGVYYYGEDFSQRSGFTAGEISVEELESVTRYFAALSNEYGAKAERNENGTCAADRERILSVSPQIFTQAEGLFPCLEGEPLAAKGVMCSRVMSYLDFTGFFFPFTGEANVNTDFPVALFASTVAHELSHQRGVAKEQEANFTAVLACMGSGDGDYLYSGSLMAYIYLGNALYEADYEAWQQVYDSLDDYVLADLSINRAYWAQFETPVQTVSNTVYEGFLQSYDQTLGLKSYGACVDLLVNYYLDAAGNYAYT